MWVDRTNVLFIITDFVTPVHIVVTYFAFVKYYIYFC